MAVSWDMSISFEALSVMHAMNTGRWLHRDAACSKRRCLPFRTPPEEGYSDRAENARTT
jgi:hypothetical protein